MTGIKVWPPTCVQKASLLPEKNWLPPLNRLCVVLGGSNDIKLQFYLYGQRKTREKFTRSTKEIREILKLIMLTMQCSKKSQTLELVWIPILLYTNCMTFTSRLKDTDSGVRRIPALLLIICRKKNLMGMYHLWMITALCSRFLKNIFIISTNTYYFYN